MAYRLTSRGFLGLALATILFGTSQAQTTPAFDPRSLREGMSGPRTQVLVLGAIHLANLTPFDPAVLEPVMDRLSAYHPDIIAVEALSGQDCDTIRRFPSRYPGTAERYCPSTEAARLATGLDVPTATAQADELLKIWPQSPTPAQRRRLATLFLAAGEHTSALVQWLQLPIDERKASDGLDAALVEQLNTLIGRKNENEQMAAVLAARLGLARVYAVDDHSADSIAQNYGPGVGPAIQTVWKQPNPTLTAMLEKGVSTPQEMLETFRFNNLSSTQIGMANGEMGGALRYPSETMDARPYVAWWETRNMRMAANIRATFANSSGVKVLVFVGSSHKAYFDAYLDQISEVQLVDVEDVLR